jgi:hypothetical protein
VPVPASVSATEAAGTAYASFFDSDFIQFSVADTVRSIPSVVDGLKPSQRKVLFACLKRNLRTEIKVAQLSGKGPDAHGHTHMHIHRRALYVCRTALSRTQTYIHTYIYIQMFTRAHTRKHTHTHTHALSLSLSVTLSIP